MDSTSILCCKLLFYISDFLNYYYDYNYLLLMTLVNPSIILYIVFVVNPIK